MTIDIFLSALLMGLLGSGHCIAMCGGISSSLTLAVENKDNIRRYTFLYNIGRVISYGIAGFIVGALGQSLASRSHIFSSILSWSSAVFMILVGLYIMRFTFSLNWIERLGKLAIWQHLVRFNKKLLPLNSHSKALAYGMLWGWLPCGLVYSALLFSISTQSMIGGTLFMMTFAFGTLPAMLGLAFAAEKLQRTLNNTITQLIFGNILIFYGFYLLIIRLL